MNTYVNRLIIYCIYCMKINNLDYNSQDNIEIDHKPIKNYMYHKEEYKTDEDFIIIEKIK